MLTKTFVHLTKGEWVPPSTLRTQRCFARTKQEEEEGEKKRGVESWDTTNRPPETERVRVPACSGAPRQREKLFRISLWSGALSSNLSMTLGRDMVNG